jgi:hypothetical protein
LERRLSWHREPPRGLWRRTVETSLTTWHECHVGAIMPSLVRGAFPVWSAPHQQHAGPDGCDPW